MRRWFVGVKPDGQREVFIDASGIDPIAESGGYTEICGPYMSERDAVAAAKSIPLPPREEQVSPAKRKGKSK